jgi:GntR family transcriptional regulator, transcriptional repressor for pyruvate dehydrogenase complex
MSHVSERISNEILGAISRGEMRPGDRLPTQRQLQRQFSVSGAAVLSALRVLESHHVVEVRRGSRGGAFILPISDDTLSEMLASAVAVNDVSLPELRELREMIECHSVRAAAGSPGSEQLEALRVAVRRLQELNQDSACLWSDVAAADRECHMAVASAAGNRLIAVMQTALSEAIGNASAVVPAQLRSGFVDDWLEMLRTVELGDGDAAADRMRRHLSAANAAADAGSPVTETG